MIVFLFFLGVVYLAGVVGYPVVNGVSPFEFPDWKWPVKLLYKWLGPGAGIR